MRLNKFIALSTGISRRAADEAITSGRVLVNKMPPQGGLDISESDEVTLDHHVLELPSKTTLILLNKPEGFVCSRRGQGSKTIYSLLPKRYHHLKPVGRLDKDSSGLILLTDDGSFAHKLTHPSFRKLKIYEVELDKPLLESDKRMIEQGVSLHDGLSKLKIKQINHKSEKEWQITMSEGRNRQIRRTFNVLGYEVTRLRRTNFGKYSIGRIKSGDHELAN